MVRKYSKWQLPKSFILNYGAYQIFRQVFATWSFLQHADFLQLAAFLYLQLFAAYSFLQLFVAFCRSLQLLGFLQLFISYDL